MRKLQNTWERRLNQLMRRARTPLQIQSWRWNEACDTPGLRLFGTPALTQLFSGELLRRKGLIAHLEKKSRAIGRCYVLLAAGPDSKKTDDIPLLLFEKGETFVVSGTGGHESPYPSEFDAWFKSITGSSFPFFAITGPLVQKKPSLWASPQANVSELTGFPHFLEAKNENGPYTLVTHAGYGCNSYAVYYTRYASPGQSVRVRAYFGGVYGNPKQDGKEVLAFIRQAEELALLFKSFGLDYSVGVDMSSWYGLQVSWPDKNGLATQSFPLSDPDISYFWRGPFGLLTQSEKKKIHGRLADFLAKPPKYFPVVLVSAGGEFPNDQRILIRKKETLIGRAEESQIQLPGVARSVSKCHARILRASGGTGNESLSIEDLQSRNGTYLNGERLTPRIPKALKRGDIIDIGPFRITIGV